MSISHLQSVRVPSLQASDERFVNANVEFNAQNLLPTYRLLWGEAGESQALAVAEGLGFDSDIVAEAHTIAHNTNFASKPGDGFGSPGDICTAALEAALHRIARKR